MPPATLVKARAQGGSRPLPGSVVEGAGAVRQGAYGAGRPPRSPRSAGDDGSASREPSAAASRALYVVGPPAAAPGACPSPPVR